MSKKEDGAVVLVGCGVLLWWALWALILLSCAVILVRAAFS